MSETAVKKSVGDFPVVKLKYPCNDVVQNLRKNAIWVYDSDEQLTSDTSIEDMDGGFDDVSDQEEDSYSAYDEEDYDDEEEESSMVDAESSCSSLDSVEDLDTDEESSLNQSKDTEDESGDDADESEDGGDIVREIRKKNDASRFRNSKGKVYHDSEDDSDSSGMFENDSDANHTDDDSADDADSSTDDVPEEDDDAPEDESASSDDPDDESDEDTSDEEDDRGTGKGTSDEDSDSADTLNDADSVGDGDSESDGADSIYSDSLSDCSEDSDKRNGGGNSRKMNAKKCLVIKVAKYRIVAHVVAVKSKLRLVRIKMM